MNILLQRFQSYFASPTHANERIDDLLIELRGRGLNFDIQAVTEDGEKYFYAESVDFPRGHIAATGATLEELEDQLKDAIFTAFEVPVRYCNPSLIVINLPQSKSKSTAAHTTAYATT